jgi:hypothetical protein
MKHVVIVEAYEGYAEPVSDSTDSRAAARGLGLPLEALAERMNARLTILTWDRFEALESEGQSFVSWMLIPATRPLAPSGHQQDARAEELATRFTVMPVSTGDPDHGQPFESAGLSQMSHGLLANSDPLFFMSYCLNGTLRRLYESDPFKLVVLPGWGGLGYVPQLARATQSEGHIDVPFALVVTDLSEHRQRSNMEGLWNRQAVTRRQCEDMSLALADLTLAFGDRGEQLARQKRLRGDDAVVRVPRHVPDAVLDEISRAAETPGPSVGTPAFTIAVPKQASAGVLATLDATVLLRQRQFRPAYPIAASGPDMTFAPMAPRSFENYWQSRAFVRELVRDKYWSFESHSSATANGPAIHLHPHHFAHLPSIWPELGAGAFVLMSAAAAEGLAPHGAYPAAALLPNMPTPENIADAIRQLSDMSAHELDGARRSLCRTVVEGHRAGDRDRLLDDAARRLTMLCEGRFEKQNLGKAAHLLLDRSVSLCELSFRELRAKPGEERQASTLSVVVPCFEMGTMLKETIESVWHSDRVPDEIIVVDDGSTGRETLDTINELEKTAKTNGYPFRVVRQENHGLSGARNSGLEAANGTYVCFLDGDDLIEPSYFRLATALLDENPLLGGVAAWSRIFSESGDTGFWNAPQAELPFQFSENCVFVPVVARTKTVRELGGYDTVQRFNYEDWEMTCRFLANGKPIITIPAYLQRYRVRDESLLRTMTPVQNQVMREYFLEKYSATVARHAGALAMLMENRLLIQLHASAENAPGDAAGFRGADAGQLARMLTTMARRIRTTMSRVLGHTEDRD